MESTPRQPRLVAKTQKRKKPSVNTVATRQRKKNGLVAFFGEEVECIGKIRNHGNVRVDGRFEGEIYTKGSLLVGTQGIINAKIWAGTVVSEGKITGDIVAKQQVKLLGTAIVNGSVNTPQLLIEKGVTLNTPWNLWMKKGKLSAQHRNTHMIKVVEANGVDQQALISKS